VSTAQARTLYDRPSVLREGLQVPGDVVSEHYRNGAIEALTRELGKVADTLQGLMAEMNEQALARASQRDWRRVEFAQYLHACPIPDERTVTKCPQPDTPVQG
jgi:hypothetical protein